MASAIKPPNDPTRPEWAILGRLTRKNDLFRPGMSEDEAAAAMKAGLEEAWLARPNEVLAACSSKMISGVAQGLRHKPGEFQNVMSYLTERMWLGPFSAEGPQDDKGPQDDSKIPEATDPERGSYAFHIRYWQPKMGGMVKYLNQRVGWLLTNYSRELARQGKLISLETLTANGADLTSDGRFVRPQRPRTALDDMDPTEAALDGMDLRAERDRLLAGAEKDPRLEEDVTKPGHAPEEAEEPEAPSAPVTAKQSALTSLVQRPMGAEILNSPNRFEFGFFSLALGRDIEPCAAPEDRAKQLQSFALTSFDTLCPDLEDSAAIRSDLATWDPAKVSFFHQFPDVTEFIIAKVGSPEIVAARTPSPVNAESAAAAKLMGLASDEEVARPIDQPGDLFTEMTMAHDTLRVSDMWRQKATPELLNSADRPDYLFLCEALKVEPNEDLKPTELHAEIKKMAAEWVITASRNSKFTDHLWSAVRQWDPAQDGLFGELIMENLREICTGDVAMKDPGLAATEQALHDLTGSNPAAEASAIFAHAVPTPPTVAPQYELFGSEPKPPQPQPDITSP